VYLRPWFRRTWVRQEVFAARELILRCGSLEINLREVVDWKQEWLQLREQDQELAQTSPLLRILDVGASAGLTATDVLLRTLEEGTSFAASDPRDLVYGVLGLIGGVDKPKENLWAEQDPAISPKIIVQIKEAIQAFPIDYSSTVSQVYQDVVRFTITQDKNLHSLCRYENQHRRAADIPAWAIDWREEVTTSIFDVEPRSTNKRRSSPITDFSGFMGGGLLRLEGFRVGTLTYVSHVKGGWLQRNGKWFGERMPSTQNLRSSEVEDFFIHRCRKAQIAYKPAVSGWIRKQHRGGIGKLAAEDGEAILPRGESLPGDLVVYLWGGRDLFLLRPGLRNRFQFLGGVAIPDSTWDDIFSMAAEIEAETFHLT